MYRGFKVVVGGKVDAVAELVAEAAAGDGLGGWVGRSHGGVQGAAGC